MMTMKRSKRLFSTSEKMPLLFRQLIDCALRHLPERYITNIPLSMEDIILINMFANKCLENGLVVLDKTGKRKGFVIDIPKGRN